MGTELDVKHETLHSMSDAKLIFIKTVLKSLYSIVEVVLILILFLNDIFNYFNYK